MPGIFGELVMSDQPILDRLFTASLCRACSRDAEVGAVISILERNGRLFTVSIDCGILRPEGIFIELWDKNYQGFINMSTGKHIKSWILLAAPKNCQQALLIRDELQGLINYVSLPGDCGERIQNAWDAVTLRLREFAFIPPPDYDDVCLGIRMLAFCQCIYRSRTLVACTDGRVEAILSRKINRHRKSE